MTPSTTNGKPPRTGECCRVAPTWNDDRTDDWKGLRTDIRQNDRTDKDPASTDRQSASHRRGSEIAPTRISVAPTFVRTIAPTRIELAPTGISVAPTRIADRTNNRQPPQCPTGAGRCVAVERGSFIANISATIVRVETSAGTAAARKSSCGPQFNPSSVPPR
jgi:hypothetical protein